jgi:hypothetical protein
MLNHTAIYEATRQAAVESESVAVRQNKRLRLAAVGLALFALIVGVITADSSARHSAQTSVLAFH